MDLDTIAIVEELRKINSSLIAFREQSKVQHEEWRNHVENLHDNPPDLSKMFDNAPELKDIMKMASSLGGDYMKEKKEWDEKLEK